MPYTTNKDGEMPLEDAVTGVKGYDLPGGSGIMTAVQAFWNYTSSDPTRQVFIIGYPGNVADDGTGEAGSTRSFFQNEAAPNEWAPGIDLETQSPPVPSFLGLQFRMDINTIGGGPEPETGIARITLVCTMLDSTVPEDFPGVDPPPIPNDGNPPTVDNSDPEKPVITFTSDSATPDEESGIVIERSLAGGEFPWDIAGTVQPIPAGTPGALPGETFPNYTFTDNLTDNGFDSGFGTYTYRLRSFKLDTPGGPSLSPPTDPSDPIVFTAEGDYLFSTDFTLDLAWDFGLTFIVDPSGIYTLVEGQTYDRLYNRGGDPFIDVPIPNPFIKTGPIK